MKRACLLAAFCALYSVAAIAQVSPDVDQGLKPFGAFEHGNIDSVNLVNGNVVVHIPVISYPQRGGKLKMEFSVVANNKGWYIYNTGTSLVWRYAGGDPAITPSFGMRSQDSVIKVTDFSGAQWLLHHYTVKTPDGSTHDIGDLDSEGLLVGHGETIDATGIHFLKSTNTLTDSRGVQYNVNTRTIIDPNGNEITPATVAGTTGWQDSLGRLIPGYPSDQTGTYGPGFGVPSATTNCPSGTASALAWNLPAYNSATSTIKFCFADYSYQTAFNQPGVNEIGGTRRMINGVVLPNLTKWLFSYDSYLDLTSVVFPTGGSISYTWATNATKFSRQVVQRVFNANDGTGNHTTAYAYNTTVNGVSGLNVETDPALNDTVVTPCAGGGYVCKTQYYSGPAPSGTLLKTVSTTFHADNDPYNDFTQGNVSANVFPTSQTITLPGGKTSTTTTTFDSGFTYYIFDPETDGSTAYTGYYALPVLQTASDYGQGAAGPTIRKTSTAYKWQTNSNYLSANLLTLPTSKIVTDGSGNKCLEIDTDYDDSARLFSPSPAVTMQHVAAPGPVRGNVSSISRQLTNTPCQASATWRAVTSYVNTYDTGMPYQSIDPLGHTTTYSYSSTFFGAYPTQTQLNSTTTPGSGTTVQHISTANYDFNTGMPTSATDENSNSTSLQYDGSWRLTQTSFPDGGLLAFSYQDSAPFSVTVTRKINSTQNEITTAVVDGVGRLSQTQFHDPDCTAGSALVKQDYVYTEDSTAHDLLTKSSTPYCSTPNTIYGLQSITHSDLLNRTKSVVQTDGSTATTTYNDNQTTVTDEAAKKRTSQADGIGRLTAVWEDPSSANYETDYGYDPLGNLLRVDQKGTAPTDSTKWRTRQFTYDSFSRLSTSNNPERGTVTYTWNDDGTLATRTAPKPNQTNSGVLVTTTYAYDEIQRLLTTTYSDGTTPTIREIYDGVTSSLCTPPTLTPANPKGRRTAMCDAAGSEAWSFDTMGRTLTDARKTSSVTKTTSYTYNANGSIATLTYPSGRTITYGYNTAARTVSAVDQANSVNYATAATYAPQGGLASLQNGASLISTLFYNSRMQPCRMAVKSSGTAPSSCSDSTHIDNIEDFTYGFNLGSTNNGNVIQLANNRNPSRTQNFAYDSFNRLTSATTQATSGTYCWGETYGYDAWGNLQSISGASGYTGCTQESGFSFTADTKNRNPMFAYDATGNTTSDGTYAYTYNGENQLLTAAGVTYTYSGDGQRVQKSNGTLYWYGTGSDPLDESDAAGNITNEYIFFGGSRIARRDSASNVNYYFSDHLGSARVVTNASGTILDDSDFYPFGGERSYNSSSGNRYKFERKERDAETGNDNFGARSYISRFGRFLSVDWSAVPAPVPYANLTNPQTLNLYSFVADNPATFADLDGHVSQGGEPTQLVPSVFDPCGYNFTLPCDVRDNILMDTTTNTTADVRAEEKQQQDVARQTEQSQAQNQAQNVGQGQSAAQQRNGDIQAARQYLSGSAEMRAVMKAFDSGHFHIRIIHDGEDRYDPNTRTVYWDPHSALKTTDGGHQTPALGLGHEMGHATGNSHETTVLGGTPDQHYNNKEERRVIRNYENPAARELGESRRHDHDGTPYNVSCPTCH